MKIFTRFLKIIIIFPSFFLITSCTETIEKNSITAPQVVAITPVANTVDLGSDSKLLMNGIYYNAKGVGFLAKNPILCWNGDMLNIYTGSDYTTYALKGGIRNDSLVFEGYSTDGDTHIVINAAFSSTDELMASFSSGKLAFECAIVASDGQTTEKMKIHFQKKLTNILNNYTIIIHDGGGNDVYSSNSLGGIKHGALSGANGMELDVNVSQDGVPFLFHDDEFKYDNINSDFCVGPVTNYKIEDIKLLAVLPDGSRVPTLDEALNTILTGTNIQIVWLDIKNTNSIEPGLALINKYKAKAALLNRTFEILIGLPTQDAIDTYKAGKGTKTAGVLTELPPDVVLAIDADVWGPQWDTGVNSNSQISYVHSFGKKVFCWTIDDPAFFSMFTGNTKPDGIITNDSQKMIYEYLFQNN
jgi:glycerophosphoryl diester phosphodiesterase